MDDLDYIKDKVRIVDLCSYAGIPVQRNGFINCIFHDEKTPSLSIKEKDNFFKCFGCGKSGSVIDFYMKLYKKDLPDAIKELKSLAGLDNLSNNIDTVNKKSESIPPKIIKPAIDINRIKECLSNDELYLLDERLGIELESGESAIIEALNKAAIRAVQNFRLERNKEIFFELYTYCLKHFNQDKSFRNYLTQDRRLSEVTIEKFDLFFVGNYYQVSSHLKKLFSIGDLQRSGLFNDDGNFIFFKHRIIIPYKHKNEIVYLRGRLFGERQEGRSKFSKYLGLRNDELNLNTPKRFFNSDVISKLFNGEKLFITEGEFDTMILTDIGFDSIGIAGVGNIPADKWLKRLLSFDIELIPDQDEAGKILEDKMEKMFLELGKEITITKLDEKDPTELVKQAINN